jgi:NAD-dependent SIR2 family protein deacetylase
MELARAGIQLRLGALNGGQAEACPTAGTPHEPSVEQALACSFRVAPCERCGGVLKPAVGFFGESVPPQKVAVAMERLDEADALLVAGSSLTVWSGFRFVKRAAARGIPIAIVNIGPTRGDDLASVKVDGECGEILSAALAAIRPA